MPFCCLTKQMLCSENERRCPMPTIATRTLKQDTFCKGWRNIQVYPLCPPIYARTWTRPLSVACGLLSTSHHQLKNLGINYGKWYGDGVGRFSGEPDSVLCPTLACAPTSCPETLLPILFQISIVCRCD